MVKNIKKVLTAYKKCSIIERRLFETTASIIRKNYGLLAQVVEHLTFNQVVRGSSPR